MAVSFCKICKTFDANCYCSTPIYPEMGATVAKFRRLAAKAGSIAAMSKEDRWAYGAAIEKAIHAKNNAWWKAGAHIEVPVNRDVGAATRGRIAREFASACARDRSGRSIPAIESAYAAAMAAKKAAAEGVSLNAEGRKKAIVAAKVEYGFPVKRPAKPPVDWAAAGRKAWATRKANEAKRRAA